MKILLYICLHIKKVSRRLCIITHLTFRDMRILDMRLFVYKHTETIEYVKKYPTFYLRKIRTLRANNSTKYELYGQITRQLLGFRMQHFRNVVFT